jgi:hypothetical protein
MADRAQKKWIAGAIKPSHEGKFSAKAKRAGETTREFAKEKEGAPGALGKEARLAETLMGMHHGTPGGHKIERRKKQLQNAYDHPTS